MSNANDLHVEANLEVIREYLIGQFKGFELIDRPDRPSSHTFTVTKSADERYHLRDVKIPFENMHDGVSFSTSSTQCKDRMSVSGQHVPVTGYDDILSPLLFLSLTA